MKPKISIIIPIGGGKKLEALESVKAQGKDVEVIIEKGLNPSANRNRGVKKAKGDLIAFINGHTILTKDWAKQVLEFFGKYKEIDVVGGPQLTPEDEGYFGRISGYALSSRFGAAGASNRYGGKEIIMDADEMLLTSANLICRKSVLDKVKFDETLYPGEDPKFIADSKKNGFKVAYSPEIEVSHRRRDNIKDFSKQIFMYGKTRPQKEGLGETMKHPSFLVPSAFVIYLILLAPLILISSWFLIPGVLYLALSVLFAIVSGIKNKSLGAIFILPFLFFTIHITYGLGFLYGMFKK